MWVLFLLLATFAQADCVRNVELADVQKILQKEVPTKKVYDCVKNQCVCLDGFSREDLPYAKLQNGVIVIDKTALNRQTELKQKLKAGQITFDAQGFADLQELLSAQY